MIVTNTATRNTIKEDHSEYIDNTITWIYDSPKDKEFVYDRTAETVAFSDIKSGDLDYQLFINFIDEKAVVYSYFYKGKDGRVWQSQVSTSGDAPLESAVSD